MTKVCLVLPCNIYVAPFYYKYERILTEMNVIFDLIIWDRKGIVETSKGRMLVYTDVVKSNNRKKGKIISFIKFGFFVKRMIKENKYEKIFVLSSYSGTMAFLSYFLSKKYNKNYWLDIRDYTYESSNIYKCLMKKVIDNAYKVAISSIGFKSFLPFHEYILVHNFDYSSTTVENIDLTKHIAINKPIRISFIGNIRYYEINKKIMKLFMNDDRYVLQFFGEGIQELEKFAYDNEIKNTKFHDRFDSIHTMDFYKMTDIINNVYGNEDVALRTAISNKFYYSIYLQLPILVSSETYMEELCKTSGLGYTFNQNDNFTNDLYNWYLNLDRKLISENCSIILKKVIKENEDFENHMKLYITKETYS